MKFDVCIEPLFREQPYPERIRKAAAAGFRNFEFWFLGEPFGCVSAAAAGKDIPALKSAMAETGMGLAAFATNSNDGRKGGSPVKKGDIEAYVGTMVSAMDAAAELGCRTLITCSGNTVKGQSREAQKRNLASALKEIAPEAERRRVTIVLEPLNTRVDHAGYFLDSFDEGLEVARAAGSASIKVLMDIYHIQIMQGDIIARIRAAADMIGHFHSAGVPGRHELFSGELNYPAILEAIAATGYSGFFGLEYFPALPDEESLRRTFEMLKPFAS